MYVCIYVCMFAHNFRTTAWIRLKFSNRVRVIREVVLIFVSSLSLSWEQSCESEPPLWFPNLFFEIFAPRINIKPRILYVVQLSATYINPSLHIELLILQKSTTFVPKVLFSWKIHALDRILTRNQQRPSLNVQPAFSMLLFKPSNYLPVRCIRLKFLIRVRLTIAIILSYISNL